MENLIEEFDPEKLIYNWKNTVAISVSRYEAPETESLIRITTKNNETIVFVIVRTQPHLVLGRKDLGIQYHMGSDEAQKLLLPLNIQSEETTQTE